MSNLNDPRVLFAAERTLMAWNRTSLGLIAFGFILERSGLLINAIEGVSTDSSLSSPTFIIGVCFILLGAMCALISTKQYSNVLKTLTVDEFPKGYTARWGMSVNIVVACLGIALVAALFCSGLN